ncbi:MAG TPA: methyltransferase domain-containing protein [Polyangiales bacterium]|nr:methyltransferase domain-containing protein [Polyangiales bacterium]
MLAHRKANTVRACNICQRESPEETCERALVRCNVRKFRDERFEVWRCPTCRSIHASQPVDLAHYYADYPSLKEDVQWRLDPMYKSMLQRLTAAGLQKSHRILDYGCGSGALVRYLRRQGYAQTSGYDAYTLEFADQSVLSTRYDCVVSQDVIEHVDSPRALLAEFDRLTEHNALIAIGTPDAQAIDLTQPDDYVHTLHVPYHRHILTSAALREHAEALAWRVARYYDTMYGNTLLPAQNPRFGLHYLRCHDDTLDLVTEPVRPSARWLLHPATPFYMFFGYFFDRHTDIMFTFHKGAFHTA